MSNQHIPKKRAMTRTLPQWLRGFGNLTIRTKLALGFYILVLLIFVSAGLSFLGSQRAMLQIDQTVEVRAPAALAASRAQANLLRMLGDIRGYLALSDPQYLDDYYQNSLAFEANLAELKALSPDLDIENQQRLVQLETTYAAWMTLPEPLVELHDDQLEREPAYRILATDGVLAAGNVLIRINSLIEIQGRRDPTADNLERLQEMAKFQGSFTAMLSALRGYVTTNNRIFRQEYEVNLAANSIIWERLRSRMSTLDPSQQALFQEIVTQRAAFLEMPQQMFTILESERAREDLYQFRMEAVPLAETMQDLLNEITASEQERLNHELAEGQAALNSTRLLILGGGVLALAIGLIMANVTTLATAGPIMRLTAVAERIRDGDLVAQATVEASDEIGVLAGTFNNMTKKLRETLQQVEKEKQRADGLLEVVIPIGVALTTERDFNVLLENMLVEAKKFCHADAGTLYLRNAEDMLEFVIVRNDSQGLALGGTTGNDIPYAPLSLAELVSDAPAQTQIAAEVACSGIPSNLAEHAQPSKIVPDYRVESLLTIPLNNAQGHTLGVLQLLNAQDPETKAIVPFDQNLQQMMESFSSLAVAALEAYIREQGLRREIQQLRIEIDHAKKEKQVAEVTSSDYFQDLMQKAGSLRSRRGARESEG